jgi:hypothetical protein
LEEEQAIAVRELDPTAHLALKHYAGAQHSQPQAG